MSLSKMFEDLALKIGSEDNEIVKAIGAEPEGKIAKTASKALTELIQFLFSAADILKGMQKEEPVETTGHDVGSHVDTSGLEMIASLATIFDSEPGLEKMASVLDEILLTIGAPKGALNKIKNAEDNEVDKLRAKYREEASVKAYSGAKEQEAKNNNTDEALKAIEKGVKAYRPNEHALSTRYSPDMPGVPLMRIGDGIFQDLITKKIYNFESGYTDNEGNKIPGGSVSNQTQQLGDRLPEHSNFSSREQILNNV